MTDTLTIEQQRAIAVAKARMRAEAAPKTEPYSGTILPLSKDDQGNVTFDSDAGIVGAVKRAVTFPADAVRGKIDPMSDEGIARAAETALVASPISAASRGGMGWAGAPVKQTPVKPKVPTSDELLETGDFGFDMARNMDVRYDPRAIQNMALKLRSKLHSAGFRESNAPKVFAELKAISKPLEPGSFASIDDLHAVRQALGKAAKPVADGSNAAEVAAASQFIRAIDDFITKPDPGIVVAGPAAAAGGVWDDAMGNWAAGKRSDQLQGVEERTTRRAAATNSGLNLDNTIRQRVSSLLEDASKSRGFSAEEIALLETVARGTAPRNVIRFIGNLLGGGGGLGAVITGGAAGIVGGAPGIGAAIATGVGAKVTANKLTKNALGKVDETTRMRSPLYQDRAANPQVAPVNPVLRSAPGRAAGVAAPQPMTPEMQREFEEFLRQKYAVQQGA